MVKKKTKTIQKGKRNLSRKLAYLIDHKYGQIIQVHSILSKYYSNTQIINFNDSQKQVHAKGIIVDRKIAVIGSANFTWSGIYGNYEIGAILYDKQAMEIGKSYRYAIHNGQIHE
jgi:phosphatidylserine/phosphatidylglycerophosphate/cardiolipin synthase-like enzyme